MTAPSSDTLRFLEAIYRDALATSSGHLLIWTASPKRSAWFREVAAAAEYASRCASDTYVGVGLGATDNGPHARAKAHEIVSVPAFWLDIDIADPVHKHENLPKTEADAWKLVEAVGYEPTAVVQTGHGLQAWWRFSGGDCSTDERRQHVAAVVRGWQQTQMQRAADLYGWHIDATFDLARIMRLPGTWNFKAEPVPVALERIRG